MYQVMIVDDEPMVVNSLALGFDWNSRGFEVVATSTSSREAVDMIDFIRPDIVFTDIKMPGVSGVELMQKVHEKLPWIEFVVISGHADFTFAQQAIEVGALAYCLKPLGDERIDAALDKARRKLDARRMVRRSAMERFLQDPETQAPALLDTVFDHTTLPQTMVLAVCCGNARSLLTGNVSFQEIEAQSGCNFYFITSNLPYLSGMAFRTGLLTASGQKQFRSFVYYQTDCPVEFLRKNLTRMLDAAYLHCIDPRKAVFGEGPVDFCGTHRDFLEQLQQLTSKNKCVDAMQLLQQLPEAEITSFLPGEACCIYNTCTDMLQRLGDPTPGEALRYPFGLDTLGSFPTLLQDLQTRMGRLLRVADLERIKNQTLRQVLEYLHQHFTQPISFPELCEQYSISPSYLSQLFKKELRMTFTEYMTRLRLERAKELLATTTLRIVEISDKVGYDYYFNFTKLFKKEVGMTPKEYRASVQKPTR